MRVHTLVPACLAGVLITPLLAAALSAPGLLPSVSLAIAAVLTAALLLAFRKRFAEAFALPEVSKGALALYVIAGIVAAIRLWGLAIYMMAPAHAEAAVIWNDAFYIKHNCFSAWWEGAVLAKQGAANVYDYGVYPQTLGRFSVDDLLYPSPFLVLPRLLLVFTSSFFTARDAWFAIEGGAFFFALVVVAKWIGGREGQRVLFLVPFLFLATPILLTLQIGNFQLAALTLSMLALVAFDRERPVTGGALLGFACLKIFPGIVVIPMLIRKRWRDVAWTAGFGAFYTVASLIWMGTQPLVQFFRYELPRLSSGEAWAWLEIPELSKVVAINESIPGLAVKAEKLGLIHNGQAGVHLLSTIYTLIALAIAVLAGLRLREHADRLTQAKVWIALISIAALRSPFVPDTYALIAPLWLWMLVMPRRWSLPVALLWIPLALVLPFEGPFAPDGMLRLGLGLVVQAIAVAFTAFTFFPPAPKPALELIQETA